ncbi:response regulator transcription factor [Petrocella sp. FN5]|uniref:response regulator transcription factor n=1 Tax=Petrocella sp. FN5 TaxID=3032002 RepID=UPI0023DB936F|nr:response regulator transcription factor [Petrocella sp. FN5]MDF1618480.1 response regulator transcription factor [Petrocella sp. FN5]
MIKILIADDQELIRHSLEIILKNVTDILVIDSVGDGKSVIRSIRKEKPDVILMDIRMPEMDGVQCTKIIKESYPDIKIIILTSFDDDDYILSALRDGASGYLLKGITIDELVDAIHKVHSGSAMINPNIAQKFIELYSEMAKNNQLVQVDKKAIHDVTEYEWNVIKHVAKGLSNKEIASKLRLSEGTVRNYLSNALYKLNLRDRTQLALWAVQTGKSEG